MSSGNRRLHRILRHHNLSSLAGYEVNAVSTVLEPTEGRGALACSQQPTTLRSPKHGRSALFQAQLHLTSR